MTLNPIAASLGSLRSASRNVAPTLGSRLSDRGKNSYQFPKWARLRSAKMRSTGSLVTRSSRGSSSAIALTRGRRVDQLDCAFGRQIGREPHYRVFEDGVGLALGARQSLAHEQDPFAKIERYVATRGDLFGKAFAPSGEAVGPCCHHELVERVVS